MKVVIISSLTVKCTPNISISNTHIHSTKRSTFSAHYSRTSRSKCVCKEIVEVTIVGINIDPRLATNRETDTSGFVIFDNGDFTRSWMNDIGTQIFLMFIM